MQYATERGTGKIVAASKGSSYGSYRCPTCRADVFLKAGLVNVAHFAHMPGQGKAECEDFHPTDDLRHQWQSPVFQASGPAIDPLQLGIELEPDPDARRGPRKWGLRLTVPKANDAQGEIRIDLGGGDIRKIPLAVLSLGPRTYRADPTALDFGVVWVSPGVGPAYRAAVEHRMEGLAHRLVTAFTATRQKLNPRSNTLRWGESYYFVWHSGREWAPPPSLLTHGLGDNQGWSCSLLALPNKHDPEIAAWLEHDCDLQVARAKREWALIYPPPYAVDDDGNLEIPSASRLLLAISPVGEEKGHGGEIACLSARLSAATRLVGSRPHFVEIGVPDQPLPRVVRLTWDGAALDSLAAKPYPAPAAEPSITLESVAGTLKSGTALHRASGAAALARVRDGISRLTAVWARDALHGELRSRPLGRFDWETEELTFSKTAIREAGSRVSLSIEQLDRVSGVLLDLTRDVVLDFGPFGCFSAEAREAREHRAAFHMPHALRARVEWLCKASGALVNLQRRPINLLDDGDLLCHVSHIAVPASLMAHRRALERELRQAEKAQPP